MSNNTKFGNNAMENITTGSNNCAFGSASAQNNTVGFNNTFYGTNTDLFNTNGNYNTAIGCASLMTNTHGSLNTAIGSNAMQGTGNIIHDENVAVGAQALYNCGGSGNCAVGTYALLNTDLPSHSSTSSNNTALGQLAGGTNLYTGNNNTFLGAYTDISPSLANTCNNSTAIGAFASIDFPNQIKLGSDSLKPTITAPGNIILTNPIVTTNPNGVVPKSYVDSIGAGLHILEPCAVATTPSQTTLSGLYVLDGYQILNGDRVLAKDPTNTTALGVYIASSGAWTRSADMPNASSAVGITVAVTNGTQAKNVYTQIVTPATVGTTTLTFVLFYTFQANIGQGLQYSGNTLQVTNSLNFLTSVQSANITSTNGVTLSTTAGQYPTVKATNQATGIYTGVLNTSTTENTLLADVCDTFNISASTNLGLITGWDFPGGSGYTDFFNCGQNSTGGFNFFCGSASNYTSNAPINLLTLNSTNATFNVPVVATAVQTTSDHRIKENVQPLLASPTFDNLNPVTYFNNLSKNNEYGFIAHEVQQEFPFLVHGNKNGESLQTINYLGLISILVAEVQELKKKIAILESH